MFMIMEFVPWVAEGVLYWVTLAKKQEIASSPVVDIMVSANAATYVTEEFCPTTTRSNWSEEATVTTFHDGPFQCSTLL